MDGDFLGKLVYGPINSAIKAHLKLLDSEDSTNYEKTITLHSKPQLGTPHTIESMFQMVEGMPDKVKEQQFKPDLFDGKVYGVPIRFTMVPLNLFLEDDRVTKMYREIEQDTLDMLHSMFGVLQDFRDNGCISTRVVSRDKQLLLLIRDAYSPLSQKISRYEDKLRKQAGHLRTNTVKLLKEYKNNQSDVTSLNEALEEWSNSICNVASVEEKISQFIAKGM